MNNHCRNNPVGKNHLGESTLHPQKIVVTKTQFLHLVFLNTCGHHILDFFTHLNHI